MIARACIVAGCPRPAAWQCLETSLVDYCDDHVNEWLRAEARHEKGLEWLHDHRVEHDIEVVR